MTRVYDQLEQCKSEVTHAQYAVQVSHRQTDALNTARSAVSSFVFDLMVNVEHGLSLFLAVWPSIMNDCLQMVAWLQNPVTVCPLNHRFMHSDVDRLSAELTAVHVGVRRERDDVVCPYWSRIGVV